MQMFWKILGIGGFVLTLSHCGNQGAGGQSGTGPFDSRGNYVEAWADNPSKWKKAPGSSSPHERKSDVLPEIATIDQPPANSVPIAASSNPKPSPAPVIARTEIIQLPRATSNSTSNTNSNVSAQPKAKTKPQVVAKAKPKPQVVAKAKPKAKPKDTRYVVKAGDSLSAIASRTGSSVSAIKSANGISGTLIRPGQSLKIPKK